MKICASGSCGTLDAQGTVPATSPDTHDRAYGAAVKMTVPHDGDCFQSYPHQCRGIESIYVWKSCLITPVVRFLMRASHAQIRRGGGRRGLFLLR